MKQQFSVGDLILCENYLTFDDFRLMIVLNSSKGRVTVFVNQSEIEDCFFDKFPEKAVSNDIHVRVQT